MLIRSWVIVLGGLTVGSAAPAAGPPVPRGPLAAAVTGSSALVVVAGEGDQLWAWSQPVASGRPRGCDLDRQCQGVLAPRWSAGSGALYVSVASDHAQPNPRLSYRRMQQWVERFDLPGLVAGRVLAHADVDADPPAYITFAGYGRLFGLSRLDAHFRYHVYHAPLAAGPSAVVQFTLTNLRGTIEPTAEVPVLRIEQTEDEMTTPRWSLTAESYSTRWDPKADPKEPWVEVHWVRQATIDVAFREPFRALGRGDDYYFLTDTGRLFRAPKPAKGTHRRVEAVWDRRGDPVTAFVTDAEGGRTFLFCDAGGRPPVVFELAPGARPRAYDRALFRPGTEGPDELRRALGYGRVLTALGWLPAPKDAKP